MRSKYRFLLLLLLPLCAQAQQPDRRCSVGLELGGSSTLFGVQFDRPFRPSSPLSWRVGVALSDADGALSRFQNSPVLGKGISVPLSVAYLVSNRADLRHSFEATAGLSLGYYERRYEYGDASIGEEVIRHSTSQLGYFALLSGGYRYQVPKGIFVRAGVELNWSLGDRYAVYGDWLAPRAYLGFGLNF